MARPNSTRTRVAGASEEKEEKSITITKAIIVATTSFVIPSL